MSILTIMQAIQIGIESIEKRNDLPPQTQQEAIKIIKRIAGRDWYIHWDKDSIIKALQDYKQRTGKAPTVTNLTETGMPKSLTIQTHFNMKASLLLKQLFPENRNTKKQIVKRNNIYGFNTKQQWLDCFSEQFNKHLCDDMCSKRYDLLRDEGTPTWNTIARHCGLSSWIKLMDEAGVEYSQKKFKTAKELYISSTTSPTVEALNAANQERKRLNNELYQLLSIKKL